jgi:hypothetical protein
VRDRIKLAVTVVPFPSHSAEAAGVVLGKLGSEQRHAGMAVIGAHFPSVRVLSV